MSVGNTTWVPTDICSQVAKILWTPTDTYKHLRTYTDTYGQLRIPADTYGHLWTSVCRKYHLGAYGHVYLGDEDSYGYLRTPTDTYGHLRKPTDTLRTCVCREYHLGAYGYFFLKFEILFVKLFSKNILLFLFSLFFRGGGSISQIYFTLFQIYLHVLQLLQKKKRKRKLLIYHYTKFCSRFQDGSIDI